MIVTWISILKGQKHLSRISNNRTAIKLSLVIQSLVPDLWIKGQLNISQLKLSKTLKDILIWVLIFIPYSCCKDFLCNDRFFLDITFVILGLLMYIFITSTKISWPYLQMFLVYFWLAGVSELFRTYREVEPNF